jgi:outer membrane protein TolC
MKSGKWKILVLFIPFLLNAESFNDIRLNIENSLKYKLAQKKVEIYKEKLKSINAKNYGSLDLEYNAVHLFSQPVMKMDTMQPTIDSSGKLQIVPVHVELPMSDKNHFVGSIVYSYPIFTGFAVTNLISKSKLELIKSKLDLQNVKRELLLNAANLYANIYALKCQINALESAKKALLSAKDKAEGFYNEGLINRSSLDEINAKYYEVIADIKNLKAQKNSLLNSLSYLVNKKIEKIDGIIDLNKIKFKPNFNNRPDVKAIKETLAISDKDIKLAKSKLYPQIGFQIGLKREGDNIALSENDYQNIDKSYAAIGIKYNIFDGGATKAEIEMAKKAKLSTLLFYNDYLKNIKTEYENDFNTYNALFYRLKSAKEEVKARKSYYEYIRAKFNEGLADSSDLNDAIAKLAGAKAKRDAIKAQIFLLNVKLKLNGGEYVY